MSALSIDRRSTDTQIIAQQPSSTFVVTQRVQNSKFVFTSANDTKVHYYILAPPKYQPSTISDKWSAIVHAGDNPKYNPLSESPVVGRCKRAFFWRRFYIEYGGSIQRDVKRDEKQIKENSLRKSNKVRKFFCKGEKELEWSVEDEAAANEQEKGVNRGQIKILEMLHTGHRKFEFSVDGRRYRWTGTRMHAGGFVTRLGMKGISFNVKLIRLDDDKLIASFKKYYCESGGKFGELNIHADDYEPTPLDETLIIQTGFCMTYSEKAKRDLVWKIIEKAGKSAD